MSMSTFTRSHKKPSSSSTTKTPWIIYIVITTFILYLGVLLGYSISSSSSSSSSPTHGCISCLTKSDISRGLSRGLRRNDIELSSENLYINDKELPSLLSASSSVTSGLILVLEQVKLTGSPPLVSRTDIAMDPMFVPDFTNNGISPLLLPPTPPTFFAASFDSLQTRKSPLGYARLTEDAVRDVVLAIISSPGRPWSNEAEEAMKEFKHKAPSRNEADTSLPHLFCRAGPVTAPYWCLSSLLSSRPQLLPRSRSSSSKVYIIDAGATMAGYFGLLSAASAAGAAGVHTFVIDPQPQCIEWASASAAASGFSKSRFTAINAILAGDKDNIDDMKRGKNIPVRVPAVTNCRGSTTQGGFIDASIIPLNASKGLVSVPRLTLSQILKNEDAIILLLKLDAMGREEEVLGGLGAYLDAEKVLNVILEFNKQRSATYLKLPSAIKAEEKLLTSSSTSLYTNDVKEFEKEAVDAGALPSQVAGEAHGLILSDEDNEVISKLYARLISSVFLDRGFECLTADRGWWSAQSPFRRGEETTQDGETLEKWANKLSRGSEVDVWCWLPAVK